MRLRKSFEEWADEAGEMGEEVRNIIRQAGWTEEEVYVERDASSLTIGVEPDTRETAKQNIGCSSQTDLASC